MTTLRTCEPVWAAAVGISRKFAPGGCRLLGKSGKRGIKSYPRNQPASPLNPPPPCSYTPVSCQLWAGPVPSPHRADTLTGSSTPPTTKPEDLNP